ncbi:MAG: hypothetical protein GX774_17130 [Armatimonadetes bacterium]|nr:hypothetical protein [Armatimonadota bacterium]
MPPIVAVGILLLLAQGVLAAAEQRACVTAGRAPHPPVVDGRLNAAEWRSAAALAGFVRMGGAQLAQPDTVALVQYDDRALYIGVRCLEPDARRPHGFVRAHDDRVFDDDSVQLFVAPEDLREAKAGSIRFGGYEGAYQEWFADIRAYYEFTVSCRGSRTEARNDVRDWSAPWSAKVGRERGAWTVEMAIPFTSLGITAPPQATLWGVNVFRVRPPEMSGWVCPGFGGYAPLPLGALYLAGARPVARVPVSPSVRLGANRLTFAVSNPTAQSVVVEATATPAGGEAVTRATTLPAGAARTLTVPYELDGRGDLRVAYAVRARGEDVPLLAGTVPLRAPGPTSVALHYFAVPGRVEASLYAGPKDGPVRARLTLQPPTGEPLTRETKLAAGRNGVLRLPVKGSPGDHYQTSVRVVDAAGKVLAEATREITVPERPRWLGTRAGLPLGVLPPWKPVSVQGKNVRILGRTLAFTDLALPARLSSAGAELLAAPMRLVATAGGKPVAWTSRQCRVVRHSPEEAVLESVWRSASLELRVRTTLEYDGFCWIEATLTPRRLGPSLDRLALEIPLRREVARYVYEGHAQASYALSPVGLRRPVGTNLWIGDEARGLAWMAESLEWVQSRDRARQVEVVPGAKATVWRTTFLDTPTRLRAPYTARFALQATPTKPVSLRKSRIFHGAYYGMAEEKAGGTLRIPAKGRLDPARGSLEMWVKPTFDTNETYAEGEDRSRYNRMFLTLTADSGQIFILYYNADDRSLRALVADGAGGYPLVLGGARMPPGEWSHVALSWGERMRLSINGTAAERDYRGLLRGSIEASSLEIDLAHFAVDELRLSRGGEPPQGVPTAAFTRDDRTLFLHHCEEPTGEGLTARAVAPVPGRFGMALGSTGGTRMDQLAADGKRIVIFHENWSRYQGYPDLEQIPRLRAIADACHARGMLFLVYFCQLMSDAAPEWPGLRDDLLALPDRVWYHRDDVKQDCHVACVNGPYGDLLLDGIARLVDEVDIDGVYMDGTTVPWECENPTHPGCGERRPDGTILGHQPIRQVRRFMKRLRALFAQRGKPLFLDAHTGGSIHIGTLSFCDGYYDGEQLARFKPGFRLSPDAYLTGYMGKQFGLRGEFLPNRHSMDQALAIALVHDTVVRGQPPAVDQALAPYEDARTRFVPYWERSPLAVVAPKQVLGSLYVKPDRALLVLGSQTEKKVACTADLSRLLKSLPAGVTARDAITGEAVPLQSGKLSIPMPARGWRLIELRQ